MVILNQFFSCLMQPRVINARVSCMSRSENTPVRKRVLKAILLFICKIVRVSLLRRKSQVNVHLVDYCNRNSKLA